MSTGAEGAGMRSVAGMVETPVDCVHGRRSPRWRIRVLHCGGHTAGSTCYYLEPSRTLFLGDMAINNIDRLSRPIAFSNADRDAYEAALARLGAVDATTGFFGHGPPLLEGLQEALIAMYQRGPSPGWLAMIRYALLRLRRRRESD
jgi:glyoxylase-like metal-dependent hydrolase (beta-lactamase superfamily II)